MILKNLKPIITLFLAFGLMSCGRKISEANYNVIPLPQCMNITKGDGFRLSKSTKIVYTEGNDKLKKNAEFLSGYIEQSVGYRLSIVTDENTEGAIILKSDYKNTNREAYTLNVTSKNVVINGASEAGTFYGIQTLRKSILADSQGKDVVLPTVEIVDYPRFAYRGMHLDVSRHMFSADFVKKYIDILALHNINRFHWHLTDDQGWRIEIKRYPELTKIGAYRKETLVGHLFDTPQVYDGKPYGGYYTQDEIRDIVKYAQDRYIEIIPEIDLPGHMLGALSAYPDLGCTGGPYEVATKWGVFEDVLCAGNDKTYEFLQNVFSEIVELFPAEYIHIGGDECPKTRWKECPKCQARIRELGLKADHEHSAEQKLQSYVMQYVEKFLNAKGRKIIGWDEILEGGLENNATIMSWRGTEGGITAAKQRHDAIMVPHYSLYFDYYQSADREKEPLAGGELITVQKVYGYEPVPSMLSEEEKKFILGTQANLWTEYIPTSDQAEYMLLPRLAALSEIQWTEASKKDYGSFLGRLENLFDYYKKFGYNAARHVYGVDVDIVNTQNQDSLKAVLLTIGNAPIYYTTDGTEPTEKSRRYTAPIPVTSTFILKAIAVHPDTTSGVLNRRLIFNKATLKPLQLLTDPNPRYTFGGAAALVDGKQGGNGFTDGNWVGFSGRGLKAVVDLKESMDISSVAVGTYVGVPDWIFGATAIIVEVSEDGENYSKVAEKNIDVVPEGFKYEVVNVGVEFPKVKARYVRVEVVNTRSIPEWHDGKGSPAMLFVDEIEIN
ncbi:MAG: family 20 glycosylhydrolase [Dysgonomonas sp.]